MKWKNRLTVLLAALLSLCFLCIPVSANPSEPVSSAEHGNAYEMLDTCERLFYDAMRPRLVAIAKGKRSSTELCLGEDFIASLNGFGIQSEWTNTALGVSSIENGNELVSAFIGQFEISKLIDALMNDLPLEMYWYDKTEGYSYFPNASVHQEGSNNVKVVIKGITFRFLVARAYQAQDYTSAAPGVDQQKAQLAYTTTRQNAETVVRAAKDYPDYKKLEYYREAICSLVDYATVSDNTPYGDPWQIISVFDNDPTTDVVCEGYAKAFQYLCDLTDFTEQVTCYLAKGVMSGGTGAGAHMWNIVVMENGKSYLVDITNSDQGSVGADGGLFLAGAAGTVADGYTFAVGGRSVTFSYRKNGQMDSAVLWGSGQDSILSLSADSYLPPDIAISGLQELVYDASAVTAGDRFSDIQYRYIGTAGQDIRLSHVWRADRDGKLGEVLTEAPIHAGFYWIEVSGEGAFAPKRAVRFEIKQAMPVYTIPTDLTVTYGETFLSLPLPEGFSWSADMGMLADRPNTVGTYTLYVDYTPEDSVNYETVRNIKLTLRVEPKDLSGAIVTIKESDTKEVTVESVTLDGVLLEPDSYIATIKHSETGYTVIVEGVGNYKGTVTVPGISRAPSAQAPSSSGEEKPIVNGCMSVAESASVIPALLLAAVCLACRKKRI